MPKSDISGSRFSPLQNNITIENIENNQLMSKMADLARFGAKWPIWRG